MIVHARFGLLDRPAGTMNSSNTVQNRRMHFVCTFRLCEPTQHQVNATRIIIQSEYNFFANIYIYRLG